MGGWASLLEGKPLGKALSGESIHGTDYAASIFLGHVGVDHRGLNVGVAEKLLHRANVIARLN